MFDDSALDVITCSESWLEEKNITGNFNVKGYQTLRSDRTWYEDGKLKKSGGLLTYIRNEYVVVCCQEIEVISTQDLELLPVVIKREKKKDILILNVYRPPKGNFTQFWNKMKEILSRFPRLQN